MKPPPVQAPTLSRAVLRAAASLLASLVLGGCLTMPAPPPEAALVRLTKINSAKVSLWDVWYEKRSGQLFLCGKVFRHYPVAGEDTSGTHLAITLFNGRDERLRELTADFAPRQIPRGYRMPGHSTYSVLLDRLPADTTRIEIRAEDDSALPPPAAARE